MPALFAALQPRDTIPTLVVCTIPEVVNQTLRLSRPVPATPNLAPIDPEGPVWFATCFSGEATSMLNIYVGNLSFNTTESELSELFGQHGDVDKVNLITDRDTGRPRGFGFVEMRDETAGRAAIEALNGVDFGGRALTVNEAKPRKPRTGGGGGDRPGW